MFFRELHQKLLKYFSQTLFWSYVSALHVTFLLVKSNILPTA